MAATAKWLSAAIKASGKNSPYYVHVNGDGKVTDEEIAEAVYELLRPGTNQFDNKYHNFEPEMTADQNYAFMVWHRGLAIPRARNVVEAIMWHGYSKKSHSYSAAEKFYNLSKEDRDAVVEFINSI